MYIHNCVYIYIPLSAQTWVDLYDARRGYSSSTNSQGDALRCGSMDRDESMDPAKWGHFNGSHDGITLINGDLMVINGDLMVIDGD